MAAGRRARIFEGVWSGADAVHEVEVEVRQRYSVKLGTD